MVIEMPVLDNALLGCALFFAPLLAASPSASRRCAGPAPGAHDPVELVPFCGDVALDMLRQDPAPSGAVLQGLFFGRIAPHRTERRTFEAPALVIGHRRDPVHPFSDAGMLADEMPNARLLEADSLFELRFAPERLTGEIAGFLDECWRPRRAQSKRRRAASR